MDILNSGLCVAKQALYHLSHSSSPFCSGYFGDEISWTICPGWPRTTIHLISASQVARITVMNHQHLAKNGCFWINTLSALKWSQGWRVLRPQRAEQRPRLLLGQWLWALGGGCGGQEYFWLVWSYGQRRWLSVQSSLSSALGLFPFLGAWSVSWEWPKGCILGLSSMNFDFCNLSFNSN
jgi:hypothetical protein